MSFEDKIIDSRMKIESIRNLGTVEEQITELEVYTKEELIEAIIKAIGYVKVMEKEKEIWEFEKERQTAIIQATLEDKNNLMQRYLDENKQLKNSVYVLRDAFVDLGGDVKKLGVDVNPE